MTLRRHAQDYPDTCITYVGPCPCALLPIELLEAILAPQFDPDGGAVTANAAWRAPAQSQRERIRLMTNYSLVCKAWKPVVERLAFETLYLHLGDRPLCEYLDPVGGAGARLLQYAQSIVIVALDSVEQHSPGGPSDDTATEEEASSSDLDGEAAASQPDELAEDEPEESSDADAPSPETGEIARRGTEPSSLDLERISRILDALVRPREMSCVLHSQAALSAVLSVHRVQRTWIAVRSLSILWAGRIRAILPSLASFSTLADLATLEISVNSSTEPLEPARFHISPALQPLRALKSLTLVCNEPAEELAPIARLLPADSRTEKVKWAGRLPANFCANLPPGPPIDFLFLACPANGDDWIDSSYSPLKDLGHRGIDKLSIILPAVNPEISSRSLKVGDLLDNLPTNVRFIFSLEADDEEALEQYVYGIDDTFMRIFQAPHAPKPAPTGRCPGELDYSYRNKPLKQFAQISVNFAPLARTTARWGFARYGDDDSSASATDWMMVEPEDWNLFVDWIAMQSVL